VTIVALVACHNRKDVTLRCLEAFFAQSFRSEPAALEAVVVDDGSTDGTGDAVRARFGAVDVLEGDGTLFWARGMQLAESRARQRRPEFLLWLNDDVVLDLGALERLTGTAAACPGSIVVGALRDPVSGAVTYSGVTRSRWHPLRTRLVLPGARPLDADTFNGNVALIERRTYERVGPIDGSFSHGQADFDYGFRARRAGFRVVVAAGTVGTCRRDTVAGTFLDPTLPLGDRWRLVQSPKGLPMRSHARYLRRHGGRLWPLFWSAPYVKLGASGVVAALRRALSRA
jgi:GT2 family glycosyltransferase